MMSVREHRNALVRVHAELHPALTARAFKDRKAGYAPGGNAMISAPSRRVSRAHAGNERIHPLGTPWGSRWGHRRALARLPSYRPIPACSRYPLFGGKDYKTLSSTPRIADAAVRRRPAGRGAVYMAVSNPSSSTIAPSRATFS